MSTFTTVHEPLVPREVLLGRTTHVRRLVPNKTRRMIGAWCFLDHYGPDDVKTTGGMWVPPHPHSGLQTVTWLFEGLGLHTDSLGSRQLIRPGQLNVMTAGHGIAHAEVSPPDAPTHLHGVQLWVCLPDHARDSVAPSFVHLPALPGFTEAGAAVTVFAGSLAGVTSGAPTYSPLVGAELTLAPGASLTVPLDPGFEYGVLTVSGDATVEGIAIARQHMSYLGLGRRSLTIEAGAWETVVVLLGGAPFEERIVMWWNFVSRSHDEIVQMRADWNGSGLDFEPPRFGVVSDFSGDRLLAPPLPNTRLKPRGRSL